MTDVMADERLHLSTVHEGPASKRIVTGYGFWIFLLSDFVMFSGFFAAYAVLLGQTAGDFVTDPCDLLFHCWAPLGASRIYVLS